MLFIVDNNDINEKIQIVLCMLPANKMYSMPTLISSAPSGYVDGNSLQKACYNAIRGRWQQGIATIMATCLFVCLFVCFLNFYLDL